MMRLVQMRYPERNLVTAGRRAKALHDEEEARLTRGGAPRTAEDPPIVDPLLGQKVDMRPPPKVAVSQPQFVEVHDAQGEFVGRMSPASASPLSRPPAGLRSLCRPLGSLSAVARSLARPER